MNYEKLTPFVNRFLRIWVKNLGLSGWHITWVWSPRTNVNERASYDAVAATRLDTSMQRAHIMVDREREWQTTGLRCDYYLQTVLLHELVHIRLAVGESLLADLGTVVQPHLVEAVSHAAHDLSISVREFYVEAVTTLLLDQEERWNTLTKHK